MSNNCAKCGHSYTEHRGRNKTCFHEDEYRPYGHDPNHPSKTVLCSCSKFIKQQKLDAPFKPKTSTIEKVIKDRDLASLSNHLLVLCGDLYSKVSTPRKYGGYRGNQNDIRDPEVIDEIKGRILSHALKIGERLWYPRGNPGSTSSVNQPRLSKTKKK
jgi:hypothetical protein